MSGRTTYPVLLWFLSVLCFTGCQDGIGRARLQFTFSVDGSPLQTDSLCYRNAAGNLYEVTEAQYFISDVVLVRSDGETYRIEADDAAHYVDVDIPGTLSWCPDENIPEGNYSAIQFTFGLPLDKYPTNFYPNPPENNMSWPVLLGGGYHHAKINGRWVSANGVVTPFNLHLGTGLQNDANGGAAGTIENSFTVRLPLQVTVDKHETTTLVLNMDINQWFVNPYIFDWNALGGSIMQNQNAQDLLKANGQTVFSVCVQ